MRLIDADALPKYTGYALSADEVAMAVENAPTIDADPLVRCRDCIYYEPYEDGGSGGSCSNTAFWMPEDGYCSDGEWKEDEED